MNANGKPLIEVDRLVRKFGDRAVLNDISFNVHRGDTLVIMGGSGCGKSTLLRHMIGSMKPTSGTVKLFGEEITGDEGARDPPTSGCDSECYSNPARCSPR